MNETEERWRQETEILRREFNKFKEVNPKRSSLPSPTPLKFSKAERFDG